MHDCHKAHIDKEELEGCIGSTVHQESGDTCLEGSREATVAVAVAAAAHK